jgi:drug/metabolite transporter (DMT)-like permease
VRNFFEKIDKIFAKILHCSSKTSSGDRDTNFVTVELYHNSTIGYHTVMTWFTFALISAILLSLTSLFEKKVLIEAHAMEFSTVLAISTAVISLPLLVRGDFSVLTPFTVLLVAVVAILAATAYLLAAKSVRHMDISVTSPLFVLGPGITAVLAFLFLGEGLTLQQVIGLVVLIVGSFTLQMKKGESIIQFFKDIYHSRYILLLVLSLLIYGFTSIMDRALLSKYGFEPGFYLGLVHVFIAVVFIIMLALFHDGLVGIKNGFAKYGSYIFVIALLTVGYRFFQVQATALAFVGLVSAVKRTSSLFTTIIGGEIFHEGHLLRKSIACAVMICGVLLLVI